MKNEVIGAPRERAWEGVRARLRDFSLSFSRGGQELKALQHVSFDVGAGEIVALVGESGAGKSVLGLSLLGLLPHDQQVGMNGLAEVCGVDMTAASPAQRRMVRRRYLGAVFQDPMTSLNPTMMVGKQLTEMTGSESEAIRLLDEVGIPHPKTRLAAYPHELSGGQRQRVMLAMAVAGEPALVIADEPTTALDVTVQSQILGLIRKLRDDLGSSFLLITHDLGVAGVVADRVVVLYGGRVVEVGPPAALLSRPEHPYTAGLVGSRITLSSSRGDHLVTLPGEPPDARNLPPGCPFAPRCPLQVSECLGSMPRMKNRKSGIGLVACYRSDDIHQLRWESGHGSSEDREDHTAGVPTRDHNQGGTEVLLRLRDVKKAFRLRRARAKRVDVLRGVSLELRAGESLAVVGESGSGKSTLLRVIAGLEKVDGGSVQVMSGDTRPQMVFQDAGSSLTPWLKVGVLIRERAEQASGLDRRERARLAREALQRLGLTEEVSDVRPVALSGGQRQRVALARATVVPPSFLLCDEPTSALDVSLAATVLNLLLRLRRQLGMGLIFVTHDLGVARLVADRIAVMYLGEIVESGPAEEVITRPAHPYTRALVAAVPQAYSAPEPVRGEPPNPLAPPSGCPFHPRCPLATDQCVAQAPPLLEHAPARLAACWHAFKTSASTLVTDDAHGRE